MLRLPAYGSMNVRFFTLNRHGPIPCPKCPSARFPGPGSVLRPFFDTLVSRHPAVTPAPHRALLWRATRAGSWLHPPPLQRPFLLQLPNPFPQQLVVHRQAGYGRLQTLPLLVDDIGGSEFQFRLASFKKRLPPTCQCRGRHPVLPTRRLQSRPTQQLQTTVILRRADQRPFPPGTASGAATAPLRALFMPPEAPSPPLDIARSSSPAVSLMTVQRNRGAGEKEPGVANGPHAPKRGETARLNLDPGGQPAVGKKHAKG